MTASCVYLAADAYMVCLTHALSTEREEVMGLCIGEIDTNRAVHIVSVIMLQRSDKRKDRVEISPEQLSMAASEAESLATLMGRPLRVIGWYHSHPHITVWPSHVDVRTQASYQFLDDGFIGLIFSCFNEEKETRAGQIQVTCFQSTNQSPEGEPPIYDRLEIPLFIIPKDTIGTSCLDALAELPKILSQEELEAYNQADCNTGTSMTDLLTTMHNGAVYTKSLCHLMDVLSGPLMQCLENRLERNQRKLESLRQLKHSLQVQLQG
ncbi:lys-63-specific deubiquitinase BRCC36-like [Acanthaster planci]|uniref:Lys-63-specific deubiquitinase BRCC36-like n=1 Tax=Acanthaster planci TaxID=133434 RepID=A0A8B7Y4J7_ACAPL|nr:lys-63-specific deubiquitinase BRCC36-like [Acanthaster planci]